MNITFNLNEYFADRQSNMRFASFDYCFNYFQSFREQDQISKIAHSDNRQTSCLQLGFYLASWGMLRGSSFLLDRSVKVFEPLIDYIASTDGEIWQIDVDNYDDESIDRLLDIKREIFRAFSNERYPTDTLITKIMLGVWGNVPALDNNFSLGMNMTKTLNAKNLRKIKAFYLRNIDEFDRCKIYTLDFDSGQQTNHVYTKAKLVDMVGFIEGARRV